MKIVYTLAEIRATNQLTAKMIDDVGGFKMKEIANMIQEASDDDAKLVELMDFAGYKFIDGCFVIELPEETYLKIVTVLSKHTKTISRIFNIGTQLFYMAREMVMDIANELDDVFSKVE